MQILFAFKDQKHTYKLLKRGKTLIDLHMKKELILGEFKKLFIFLTLFFESVFYQTIFDIDFFKFSFDSSLFLIIRLWGSCVFPALRQDAIILWYGK